MALHHRSCLLLFYSVVLQCERSVSGLSDYVHALFPFARPRKMPRRCTPSSSSWSFNRRWEVLQLQRKPGQGGASCGVDLMLHISGLHCAAPQRTRSTLSFCRRSSMSAESKSWKPARLAAALVRA